MTVNKSRVVIRKVFSVAISRYPVYKSSIDEKRVIPAAIKPLLRPPIRAVAYPIIQTVNAPIKDCTTNIPKTPFPRKKYITGRKTV
jgi:hypothetical protein